jgi:hypothetical protein
MGSTSVTGSGTGEAGKKTVYASQVVKKDLVQYLVGSDQGATVREYDGNSDETFKTINVTNLPETLTNLDVPSAPYYPVGMPRRLNLYGINPSYDGSYGGFTDGQYAYFPPYASGNGVVPRVNLYDFSTITSVDLALTDPDYNGFGGGTTDGRYGYFMPFWEIGKLVRLDLQDFATADDIDLTTVDAGLEWTFSCVVLGRYLYTHQGENVIRINLDEFENGASAVSFIVADVPGDFSFLLTQSTFTDGQYVYMLVTPFPGYKNILLKVNPNNFTTSGIEVMEFSDSINSNGILETGIALNGYLYLFAYSKNIFGDTYVQNGMVVRINSKDFNDIVTTNLIDVDPNVKGFYGSCSDGKRYIYISPDYVNYTGATNHDPDARVIVVRLDTFNWPNVETCDITQSPFDIPGGGGCLGAFSDGRYAYIVQSFDATTFATMFNLFRFQMFAGGNI